MDKKEVGKIAHYFPKIGVAVVEVSAELKKGDVVTIGGKSEPFEQTVNSLQIEMKEVESVSTGQVGMKVEKPVKEGDIVWK